MAKQRKLTGLLFAVRNPINIGDTAGAVEVLGYEVSPYTVPRGAIVEIAAGEVGEALVEKWLGNRCLEPYKAGKHGPLPKPPKTAKAKYVEIADEDQDEVEPDDADDFNQAAPIGGDMLSDDLEVEEAPSEQAKPIKV